ncbi:hypothetical protein [Desulfotignum balticum]|uniref:hypothetical protein n=1 Tax=Desulfotignum balticum TaxID=115781 RepID=UPI00040817F3|nr:hypothetical protein [Desulfotignum balticum]
MCLSTLAGTVIGLVRALPQLVRLLRSRQALGVSVDTALTSAIVSFGWAAYGVLTNQPYVTLATGASAAVFFVITISALKFGRTIKEFRIAPVWFVALCVAFLIKGQAGLGIILPISILVSNIPQICVAAREEDLTDLSFGTWVLSMSDGLVWGLYSVIEQDYSIMVFALFQLMTSGAIVFLKFLNQKKRHAEV